MIVEERITFSFELCWWAISHNDFYVTSETGGVSHKEIGVPVYDPTKSGDLDYTCPKAYVLTPGN